MHPKVIEYFSLLPTLTLRGRRHVSVLVSGRLESL